MQYFTKGAVMCCLLKYHLIQFLVKISNLHKVQELYYLQVICWRKLSHLTNNEVGLSKKID